MKKCLLQRKENEEMFFFETSQEKKDNWQDKHTRFRRHSQPCQSYGETKMLCVDVFNQF